jgi:hypothetical protein
MRPGRRGATGEDMAAKRRTPVTCDDCYFRREGLCALVTDVPCPTFRTAATGALSPPVQPTLVPRPLAQVAAAAAA